LINPRQSQPYIYSDSPLTSFPNRDAEFGAGPGAGAPLINHRIGTDRFLLDELGPGFTGLYFAEASDDCAPLDELASELAVGGEAFKLLMLMRDPRPVTGLTVLGDPDGRLAERYGAQDGSFYLVRPDRHVCARWRTLTLDEVRLAFASALGKHNA
jgi:3-(3-hydroxy-phenyl)propionate hydroxylase